MIDIKKIGFTFMVLTMAGACIEPNTDDLWSITIESIMQTDGYARDVTIDENTAYVAAGQFGVQIWDLTSQNKTDGFTGYVEGGTFLEFEDLAIIRRDSVNHLIFASESNKDVKIFHYAVGDTDISYRNTIMSAKTKDFISFPGNADQFIMFAADNDDGMKWHTYNLDTTDIFEIEFITWTPSGGNEIYTPGKSLGIDSDGVSYIVMAVDQLGVELYAIDSLGADPILVGRVDTEGNAEEVTLGALGVFASCDDAGAYFIPFQDFQSESNRLDPVPIGESMRNFAEDLTVDHIAVNNGIAALSLGAKGVALYDVTNPSQPIEKGIFPVGYTYKTQFWGNKLVVCSREGLQIITIDQ
jgi:hypothetical protein